MSVGWIGVGDFLLTPNKYKCLWGVGDKSRDLSLQEGVSHTYTLRLN